MQLFNVSQTAVGHIITHMPTLTRVCVYDSDTGELLSQMSTGDFFGEIGILNLDGGVNKYAILFFTS